MSGVQKSLAVIIESLNMSENRKALANITYTQPTHLTYGPDDTFQEMLVTDQADAKVNVAVNDYVGTETTPGDNVFVARPRLQAPIANGHEAAVPPLLSAFQNMDNTEAEKFRDVIQATYAITDITNAGGGGHTAAQTYISGDATHAPLVRLDARTGTITAFTNTATRGWGYSPLPVTLTVTATCNYYKYAGEQPPKTPKSFVVRAVVKLSWSLVNAVHNELYCVLGHNPPSQKTRTPGGQDYSYYTQLYMSPAVKVAAGKTRPAQSSPAATSSPSGPTSESMS